MRVGRSGTSDLKGKVISRRAENSESSGSLPTAIIKINHGRVTETFRNKKSEAIPSNAAGDTC